MGAVYQARDMRRQAICAIKEMSLSMVPPNERSQAIHNFKVEAKILSGLHHSNLPTFTGFFTEGQRHFLVMEYIDGQTLEALLEQNHGPFSERRVLGWAKQLCDVLSYLHKQKPPIIFRDMKPGNIMLTREGRIKLIDFGIARFFRQTSSLDTQTLGTPGFAPPEQYGQAQTDERSDIYSLAITLYQLLTNNLSESGFGLKNIRGTYPDISPVVARALEKAASLAPQDRYATVEEFERALLGTGLFVFENGDQATTPEELAELCARHTEEAADYLYSGEIEDWLTEIEEPDLALASRRIRSTIDEPEVAVDKFIQVVLGPSAHVRSYNAGRVDDPRKSTGKHQSVRPPEGSYGTRQWLMNETEPEVTVQPMVLDFGQIYAGVSAPQTMTITGNQGIRVRGTIEAIDPWIIIDRTSFDAPATRVNVRINSARQPARAYNGTIIITPEGCEDDADNITVSVRVEVLQSNVSERTRKRTHIVPEEDDDDDDYLDVFEQKNSSGNVMVPPRRIGSSQKGNSQKGNSQKGASTASRYSLEQYEEYESKYGPEGGSYTTFSSGWDPLHSRPRQRIWHQRGLTFLSSLMLASLGYTLLSHLAFLPQAQLFSHSPLFIIMLLLMIPGSVVGALLLNWGRSLASDDIRSQFWTGLTCSFLTVTLGKVVWENIFHLGVPQVELLVVLLLASLSATAGTHSVISDLLIRGAAGIMRYFRTLVIGLAPLLGACLGFLLALGYSMILLVFIAIVSGLGIFLLFVLHVDHLMQLQEPTT